MTALANHTASPQTYQQKRNSIIASVIALNPKATAADVERLLNLDERHILTNEQLALVPDGMTIDNAAEQRIALAVLQDAALAQAREARRNDKRITTTPPQPFTLASLASAQFPPLESLPVLGQSEIIVKGFSHILSGDPKDGKTTLLVNVMPEWPERVRYYSEESARLWHARRVTVPGECFANENVTIVPAIGMSYDDMLADARDCPETVIVVDTIRSLWGFTDENDNSEIARACKPWAAMAQATGKTLILIHHDRKSGGANGMAIAGGGAFLAVVDLAVMVTRDPTVKTRRKIETLGRVVLPVEFMYELDDRKLVYLGAASAMQFEEVKRRVLSVLDTERPMTTQQVRAELDPKPSLRQVAYALESCALDSSNRIRSVVRNPRITEKAAGRTVTWLAGTRANQ